MRASGAQYCYNILIINHNFMTALSRSYASLSCCSIAEVCSETISWPPAVLISRNFIDSSIPLCMILGSSVFCQIKMQVRAQMRTVTNCDTVLEYYLNYEGQDFNNLS